MALTLKGKFEEVVAALGTPGTDIATDIADLAADLATIDAALAVTDGVVDGIAAVQGALTDVAGETSVVALLKAIKAKTDTIG